MRGGWPALLFRTDGGEEDREEALIIEEVVEDLVELGEAKGEEVETFGEVGPDDDDDLLTRALGLSFLLGLLTIIGEGGGRLLDEEDLSLFHLPALRALTSA